ncbi:hypothetical protein BJV77DRAFT_965917 [Russula vinacea]|nr:hypothetical protein BJV77DRAFT_965917 [Russula vinacea]
MPQRPLTCPMPSPHHQDTDRSWGQRRTHFHEKGVLSGTVSAYAILRLPSHGQALAAVATKPNTRVVVHHTFNPSGVFLPDDTIAHLIGKACYPPPAHCRPVVIETVVFTPYMCGEMKTSTVM